MRPRRALRKIRALGRRRPTGLPLPYDIDSLVYSSHKSGTQTLLATLEKSGIPARHIHLLGDAGMSPGRGAFRSYLKTYRRRRNRKLSIVSTFRLPLERHMSSFFQRYGHGAVRDGLVRGIDDTIIARLTVDELQQGFLEEVRVGSLAGRLESLHELCGELGYRASDLPFDTARGFGAFEDDLVKVHLFRFDLFFPDFPPILEDALDVRIVSQIENISADKWYGEKFHEFKTTLKAPPDLIRRIHEAKKDLIEVFYPGRYQEILNERLDRYGLIRSIRLDRT